MELCILRFNGSHKAEEALEEVIKTKGDRNPWLYDVGAVARPRIGRVRIGATFPDGKSNTFHEGDLADAVSDLGAYTGYYMSSLASPFGGLFGSMESAMAGHAAGSEAEQRLLHIDELKKALPRDTSALALVASRETCDAMVELFKPYAPTVIRRDVAEELRKRLEALHRRLRDELSQAEAQSGAGSAAH